MTVYYDFIKINTVFNDVFVTGDKCANKNITIQNYELYQCINLREYLSCVVEPTLSLLEEFQERDSGWAMSRILSLTVNANKHNPLRTRCQIPARNAKESGNQCTNRGQYMFRMVCCCCSTPDSKKYGTGILIFALYVGSKSRGHQISYGVESN